MKAYEHWTLSVNNRVGYLTINRVQQKNKIDGTTLKELEELTDLINENPEIWVVILNCNGDHFSAGVDVSVIGEMINQDDPTYRDNLRYFQSVLDKFEALEKPVIAQLKGYVIGGGLILALCCDFRIASDNTIVALPEVKRSIGVIMGTQRITRTIGIGHTKELVMLGNPIDAKRGMEMGLFHDVVALSHLDDRVQRLVDEILELPPLAVGLCKKIINEGQFLERSGQDLEIESQAALLRTKDFKEAIDSFFEKRKPDYKGS